MALTEFDQRTGSYLARLPLVARCQPPQFGEDGIGFEATSGKKLLNVVNFSDHSNLTYLYSNQYTHIGYMPHFPTTRYSVGHKGTQDENWSVRFGDYRTQQYHGLSSFVASYFHALFQGANNPGFPPHGLTMPSLRDSTRCAVISDELVEKAPEQNLVDTGSKGIYARR